MKKESRSIAIKVCIIGVLLIVAWIVSKYVLKLFDTKDKADLQKALQTANVGDYVTLGVYEQDNVESNGKEPIEWLVLDKQDDRILVISRYALDWVKFNEFEAIVTWETCTLRQWLNGEFYAKAFTENEKKYILEVTVPADRNPYFSNVDSGKAAQDRVFLLSIPEYEKLLTSEEMRIFMKPGKIHKQGERDGVYWWLRSPGCESIKAAFVFNHGNALFTYGDWVTNGFIAVRPILWIELKS